MLQKANYILSVKCLMAKPGTLTHIASVKSRWEDFMHEHQRSTPRIHWVGQFLPWHRLFLHEYEQALRKECLYFGPLPYWDQTLDATNWAASPVFSPTLGFGGDGEFRDTGAPFGGTGGGCIQDGPFKNLVIHLGYENDASYHERCLSRNLRAQLAAVYLTPEKQAEVLALPDFESFAVMLEGELDTFNFCFHGGGHISVGGDMDDMFVSAGDPIFYLHHANIDRLWALWQDKNPARVFAIGNPIAPRYDAM